MSVVKAQDTGGYTWIHSLRSALLICTLLFFLPACAVYNAQKTAKTPIVSAQEEIPEEELLDVGIAVFESGEIPEKKARKQGTNPDVRNAEGHFVPYHLKNTLEQSGHWGMVRVTPVESDSADVLVTGEIVESNGQHLALKVTVKDSTGRVWLEKKYSATVTADAYGDVAAGQKDAFQGLYNRISNDMANHLGGLSSEEVKAIRTISELKFAQGFAPDAFGDYLKESRKGDLSVDRLPADDDPMIARILTIRERGFMFEDTLNEYYEEFYNEMWPPYKDWRLMNLTERVALREQKMSALYRQAAGVLLIAAAIGLQAADVHDLTLATGALVVIGGQVFLKGVNISKQAEMHYEALEELGESFGGEMQPVVMEFEGETYELSGSAEEQYRRWRQLLREIYYAEPGFDPSTALPKESS
jgi:hypothetical protein